MTFDRCAIQEALNINLLIFRRNLKLVPENRNLLFSYENETTGSVNIFCILRFYQSWVQVLSATVKV